MSDTQKFSWYTCPECGKKMIKLLPSTKLINFPAYCKVCKKENIINVEPKSQVIEPKAV